MIHLLFFAALVSTANGLTCACSGVADCTAEKTCIIPNPSSGKCFSFIGTREAGKYGEANVTMKGCQNDASSFKMCDEKYVFITAGSGYFLRTNVACCSTDNCNNKLTPELKKNDTRNNLVCPSCFSFGTKPCDTQLENCTGSQTHCLNVTGKLQDGSTPLIDFVGKGCATATANFLKNDTKFVFGTVSFTLANVTMEKAKNGACQLSSCLTSVSLLLSTMGLLLSHTLY